VLVVDAEGADAQVVAQALALAALPAVVTFEHAVGFRGERFGEAALELGEALLWRGYACAMVTDLDTLCARAAAGFPGEASGEALREASGAKEAAEAAPGATAAAEQSLPAAVRALAAALAPRRCAAVAGANWTTVSVNRFGGSELVEVGVEPRPSPSWLQDSGDTGGRNTDGQSAGHDGLWLGLESAMAQWRACLALHLTRSQCDHLRAQWCSNLEQQRVAVDE